MRVESIGEIYEYKLSSEKRIIFLYFMFYEFMLIYEFGSSTAKRFKLFSTDLYIYCLIAYI
jgi:hypothetical protein